MGYLSCTVLAIFFSASLAFGYTEPAKLTISHPTPTATKTVCASGCDYATLTLASAESQPGWLIKVKAGNYGPFTWTSSGVAGNEIVIVPYGDGDVIFTATSVSGSYIRDCSYIIFDGGVTRAFKFEGSARGTSIYNFYIGYNHTTGPNHIIVSGVEFYNSSTPGSGASNVVGFGSDNVINNVVSKDSTGAGIYIMHGDRWRVTGSILDNNHGAGIQVNPHQTGESCDDIVVDSNLIINNGYESNYAGIALLSGTSFNQLYDVYIYNNIIYNNYHSGININDLIYASNVRIWNNTIYDNITRGLLIYNKGTVSIKNNIVYSNGTTADANWIPVSWGAYYGPDCANCSNNLATNPDFSSTDITESSFCYIPLTSDAKDAGTNVGVTVDYRGAARSIVDIGALEYTPPGKRYRYLSIIDD